MFAHDLHMISVDHPSSLCFCALAQWQIYGLSTLHSLFKCIIFCSFY